MTMLIIGLMTGISSALNNPEIIFPEIAAIAVGSLLTPKFAWNTSKFRMLIFICLCAVLGVLTVKFVPFPPGLRLCAAFCLAQVILLFSGTTFAPMLSAFVLPVMLGTDSPVYLISAFVLTAMILLMRLITEKISLTEPYLYQKQEPPGKVEYLAMILRMLSGSAVILAAVGLGWRFAVAPPLLVAFTEFSKPNAPAMHQKGKVIGLFALCSMTGTILRYLFLLIHAPACLAAMITILIVFIIMKKMNLFLPPAAAISILTFLIPETALLLFPVQITAGTAALVGTAWMLNLLKKS